MRDWLKLSLLFSLAGCQAASFPGCGASYPRERVAQEVVDLSKREYRMDVSAKLMGNTLAARTAVKDLFETPISLTSETDAQALSGQLKFSSKGLDHLQHVALIVRRVTMSTDAPIEFYHVIIEDADSGQLEFHWIGSVLDLKRLSAMDISQGDFLKYRSSVYFRAAPAWLCKQAVEQLFEDLRNRAPIPKIAKHFSPQADLRSLLPFLIQNLTPTESGEGPASLADVKALQISEDGALVFARMLLPVDQAGTSTVREQGYYFLFDVGELNALIRRVVLISSSPVGNQNRWEIPPEFVRHGSPQQWSDQNWFAEPIGMPRFLAHQIARRVRYDLGSLPEMSGFGIAGEFLENEFHFQFRLAQMAQPGALAPAALAKKRDKETKKLDPKTPEGLAGLIVQTAAQVIHSYEFKNFKGLSVVDAESGKSWQFKADQLDIYRRKPVPLPSVQP